MCVEVATPFGGGTDIAQDEGEERLVQPSGLAQLQWGDDHSLLVQLRGDRHGACRHPADVGVVRPVRDKADELARCEHGRHQGHVGEVGAAQVGVVDDGDVSLAPGRKGRDGRHRLGHGAEVHGDVGGLRDHLAVGIEDGAGEVSALADVGRVARPPERHAHLLRGRSEEGVPDGKAGGIVAHDGVTTRFPAASTAARQPGGM